MFDDPMIYYDGRNMLLSEANRLWKRRMKIGIILVGIVCFLGGAIVSTSATALGWLPTIHCAK